MEYNPRQIEQHWRKWWSRNKIYKVKIDPSRPKFYILDMFPYPSGAGLHVGHPLGYIASDILARFKRLQGFNVLHPMGYDAFGLPAEQYAIENGIHPEKSTNDNIKRYRAQLDNIGFSFDWSREVRTCDPEYYRWTQWIFLQLYSHYYDNKANKALPISKLISAFEKSGNARVQAATAQVAIFTAAEWKAFSAREQEDILMNYRLAYRKTGYVNWCEALGTVLANDEVTNGVSERGGHPVELKPMVQWSLRITAYADRLLQGLEEVDFPEALKQMQRNWIGRSEGAQLFFEISSPNHSAKNPLNQKLEIYTTRPDTIFGATFMVLAPEHDLVAEITAPNCQDDIDTYLSWVKSRTERDRMSEVKLTTGAFTGAYAIHPFTGEKLPIWISEYVLKGYGTGAIMAVPADDERDLRFAEKFQLPIVPIIDKSMYPGASIEDKLGKMINSQFLNGMEVKEAISAMCQRVEKMGIGKAKVQFKLRDANFSRQRYWGEPFPVTYNPDGIATPLPESALPLVLPPVNDFKPGGGKGPLGKLTDWVNLPGGSVRETDTMPGFAGSSWYFLRYMDARNKNRFASKKALYYWQDVDFYIGGAEHAVGHLMYSRMWHKFLFDKGLVPTHEPYKKLVNQGMIQGRSNFVFRATERSFERFLWHHMQDGQLAKYGPIKANLSEPEAGSTPDFYFEHSDLAIEVVSQKQAEKIERVRQNAENEGKRLLVIFNEGIIAHINDPKVMNDFIEKTIKSKEKHTVFGDDSRFDKLYVSYDLTQKFEADCFTQHHVDIHLTDSDYLNIPAAAQKMQFERSNFHLNAEGKFLCSWEVEKMSKSKYNVVNPDDMVEQYGADCFRMYEMFLGPIEVSKPWDTKGITGVSSFLRRFWSLFFDGKGAFFLSPEAPTREEWRVLHTCIKKVSEDIERFSMNTCVSHFMICVNELKKLNCSKKEILSPLVVLIAPFAPHLAEELWHQMGHNTTVCDATWPQLNEEYLKTDSIVYPVQINGKHRGNLDIATDMSTADIEKLTMEQDFVQRNIAGTTVKKFIVVPGRIINIVVG